MILSDRDLKRAIREKKFVVTPGLSLRQIGPASIDLTLSPIFKLFHITKQSLLDPRKGLPDDFMETRTLKLGEVFILHPNNFILASTRERIKVPYDMVVRVEGKSTLARMGILVHTAGFVDPGFEGNITLEISNQSNLAVVLCPGMYICQIAVETITSPAEVPYDKRKRSIYRKEKARGTVEADPRNLF